MKKFIVTALEWLCGWLDKLPGWYHDEDGWHFERHACLGCRLRLAQRSAELDAHWKTGHWKAGPAPE